MSWAYKMQIEMAITLNLWVGYVEWKKKATVCKMMGCTYSEQIEIAIVIKVMGRSYRMQNKMAHPFLG